MCGLHCRSWLLCYRLMLPICHKFGEEDLRASLSSKIRRLTEIDAEVVQARRSLRFRLALLTVHSWAAQGILQRRSLVALRLPLRRAGNCPSLAIERSQSPSGSSWGSPSISDTLAKAGRAAAMVAAPEQPKVVGVAVASEAQRAANTTGEPWPQNDY